MGNTAPTNNGICEMFIQTQFPFYNSGSIVRGVVFLNTRQQLCNQSLYLRIEGKQRCMWYEGSSFNRKRYEGIHEFYNLDFVLARFDSIIEPGCYAWPFTICLSQNLPGSFESALNPQIFIRYQLGCYLVDYIDQTRSHYHWRPLILRQPFRLGMSPLQGDMISTPATCFCSGSGATQIHGIISKNVCFIGQTIMVHVDINNTEGLSPVKGVNIALVQNLFVTSNTGAVRTFKKPLHIIQTDGSDACSLNSYDIDFDIPLGIVTDSSAIGTVVANYYTIEITALTGGFLSTNQPYANIPIFIIAQQPLLPKYVEPYEPGPDTFFNQMQAFQPPPYFFKQNTQLPIMNFAC